MITYRTRKGRESLNRFQPPGEGDASAFSADHGPGSSRQYPPFFFPFLIPSRFRRIVRSARELSRERDSVAINVASYPRLTCFLTLLSMILATSPAGMDGTTVHWESYPQAAVCLNITWDGSLACATF